jgi:hypothetical protein
MCVGLDGTTGQATYFICTKEEWYDGGKEEQFRRIEPTAHWALISEAAMKAPESSPRTNDVGVFFAHNKVSPENKCRLTKESSQMMRAINNAKKPNMRSVIRACQMTDGDEDDYSEPDSQLPMKRIRRSASADDDMDEAHPPMKAMEAMTAMKAMKAMKAIKAPPKALKAMKVMKTMKAPKATKAVKAMKAMKATKAMT